MYPVFRKRNLSFSLLPRYSLLVSRELESTGLQDLCLVFTPISLYKCRSRIFIFCKLVKVRVFEFINLCILMAACQQLNHSRVTTSLPLPEDSENTRPRIDFIVLFIDLTNNLR